MTDRPKARRLRRKKDVSPAAPKPHGLPSTLSRIRLSLSFRIAAHFSFQLVRTFLPALLILTLPGIGGIVLTIGMAVDANVLVYERIREELRQA